MKQKAIRFSSLAASIAFVAVFFATAISNTPNTNAISTADFKAGNIIDDAVFYNKDAMSVEEIQAHLNRYMPACDTWGTGAVGSGRYINGRAIPANTTRADYARQMREAGKTRYHEPPYICVQNYYENPTTHETLYETKNVIKDGMISAAQIIYNAAQKYNINPQVLLVLLKKESYVWGDNWPLKDEYNTVMGYACPDNAPCDEKYFGFYNQVTTAAWQLNYYKEHIYSYNYRPYATNYILYSPDASCGRKEVYLENLATTSLYIYTPYTPNDAALRNYPGTATCGSYGNRNFFMYFTEWFGDTHGVNAVKRTIPEAKYIVTNADNTFSSTLSFKRNQDNSYTITDSNNAVMDLVDGQAFAGTEIKASAAADTLSQKWFIYSDGKGGYYIASAKNNSYIWSVNAEGKLVLDIYGSKDSKPLKLTPVVDSKLDGEYVVETKLKKDLVLDLYYDGKDEGTNITMVNANGTGAQDYTISYDEKTGYYKIATHHGTVLTVNGSLYDGANLQTNSDKGECSQRFMIAKNNNDYIFYSACDLSYAIDVANAETKEFTNVWVYTYNGSDAQWWNLKKKEAAVEEPAEPATPAEPEPTKNQPIEDGSYLIHSAIKKNFVLDVYGAGKKDGTNIAVWAQNNSVAQVFDFKYNAEKDAYMIVNPNSKAAIDLANGKTTDGSNLWIYAQNDSCAQYWKIKKHESGNYIISSLCNEKYVFDVAYAGTSDNTNAWVYTYNGSIAQQWYFEKYTEPNKQLISDGDYIIHSAIRNNFVLDVYGAGKKNGTNVAVWTQNNSVAQIFNVKYDSAKDAYRIVNPNSNAALDLANGKAVSGSNLWIYGQNNTCAQFWKIKKYDNGNYSIATTCNENYVLDVANASKADNTNVWVYAYNGTIAQQWSFEKR